jgi:endogenous inhibitor of DNA gyrase (YacG/DUF329 family)
LAHDKHSSITSQVIAGVVVAAIIGAVSFIPGVFKWLEEAASSIWSHLRGTSELSNWSLYLLALMSIHTLVYWIARVTQPKGPNITEYNQDTFLGVTWRWSYISGHPVNAWAFCPHCDTVLVYSEGSQFDPTQQTVLTCETCGRDVLRHDGSKNYLVEKIHRQIDRKIRSGEWLSVVKQNP